MRDCKFVDDTSFVIWVMEPGRARKYLNHGDAQFDGEARDASRGPDWLESVHPDDRAHVASLVEAASVPRERFQLDYRIRNEDGDYERVVDEAHPWFDQDGEFRGYVGVVSAASGEPLRRRFPESSKIIAAQEALRASERRYRELVQNSNSAIIRWSCDGTITFFNEYAQRFFGWSAAEAIGKNIGVLVPERELLDANMKSFLQDIVDRPERYVQNVNENVLRDGRRVWMNWTNKAIRNKHGDVVEILSIGSDFTELKKAEESLAEKARLLDLSNDAIVVRDAQERIAYWNMGAVKTYGYDREEAIGKRLHELLQTEFPEPSERIAEFLRKEGQWNGELRHTCKDGSVIIVSSRWSLDRDVLGNPLSVMEINTDITEHRRAEDLVRQSERRFRQVVESLPQLVWTCNSDGRCDYLSPQWVAYTGVPESQQLNFGWAEQLHPDDRESAVRNWLASVNQGLDFSVEYRVRRHDGVYRWFKAMAMPLRDEGGRIVKWLGSNTDVDERMRAEEALREADRRKDEFLATLAHELRNPLAPIRNALHVLKRCSDDDPSGEHLYSMMERQVDHLVRLVDDLLEVSRITSGKIELKRACVDLASLIAHAVEMSQPLIRAAGHELSVSFAQQSLVVDADPVRISQVFANLLNNAAKYTEPGGRIQLSAQREGAEAVVSVSDTGAGIPTEMLPRVFDLFTQIDHNLGRAMDGVGIGLALVRSLVTLHGGRVEARSDGPGRGAEFIVRLPLIETHSDNAIKEGSPMSTPSVSRRILVVDDNRDVADSLVMLLECLGAEVRVAYDGPSAVEAVSEFAPEIALVDIGMPGMDGYETARRIRERPQGRELVLIALTGWGQEEDRRRTREVGFDRHLVKPVNDDVLQELLSTPCDAKAARMLSIKNE
jgi:PAS domain S-box-containing protein